MRTIIDGATLPPARSFHAWASDEDLPDHRVVKLKTLSARDAAAQELEEAFYVALLVDRFGGPDDIAAAAATIRLVEAQMAARVAEMSLASQWARAIGGDIRRKAGVAEAVARAGEKARKAEETARRVAQEAERVRAYRERVANAPPPQPANPAQVAEFHRAVRRVRATALGGSSVLTGQVSLEKAGLHEQTAG